MAPAPPIEEFSSGPTDLEAEQARLDARFTRWFGIKHPRELHYILLWGIAGAIELKFLYSYCEREGFAATAESAAKVCERLQEKMRAEREYLDRPEPSNAEIARRFLAEEAPAAPDPLAELSWPDLDHVQAQLFDPEIKRLAFLEIGADDALREFLGRLGEPSRTPASRHAAIESAVREMSTPQDYAETYNLLHRSAHALDDAFRDWRRHGDPEAPA